MDISPSQTDHPHTPLLTIPSSCLLSGLVDSEQVQVEFDSSALVDVQVGEPHREREHNQQQQEFELLPDFLHREAQHPAPTSSGYRLSTMEEMPDPIVNL
ncbi:hypothetical protein DPEC_G00219100 [Dallia pectoralis]|uniref:Uncharacterized protein n=1 Tax=Dallia pectoralis TaxID=75939 RepID=A0ACC2G3C7_DALPE|nr:hypothetical protein DPEC_G00219100 [Dallia pectoralis]